MNLLKKISIEDHDLEDLTPDVVDLEEKNIDEVTNDIHNIGEEINEHVTVINDTSTDLDNVVTDVSEIESVAETLQSKLEDPEYDGLDEVSIELLRNRFVAIQEKHGFSINLVSRISKEDFEPDNRRTYSEVSLEDMKDWAKKTWNTIKNIWDRIVNYFGDLFQKLFGSLDKYIQKLDELEKIANSKEFTKENDEVDLPRGVGILYPGEKVDMSVIDDSYNDIKGYMELNKNSFDLNNVHLKNLIEVFKKGETDKEQSVKFAEELVEPLMKEATLGEYRGKFTKESPGIDGKYYTEEKKNILGKQLIIITPRKTNFNDGSDRKLILPSKEQMLGIIKVTKETLKKEKQLIEDSTKSMDTSKGLISEALKVSKDTESGKVALSFLRLSVQMDSIYKKDLASIFDMSNRIVKAIADILKLATDKPTESSSEK